MLKIDFVILPRRCLGRSFCVKWFCEMQKQTLKLSHKSPHGGLLQANKKWFLANEQESSVRMMRFNDFLSNLNSHMNINWPENAIQSIQLDICVNQVWKRGQIRWFPRQFFMIFYFSSTLIAKKPLIQITCFRILVLLLVRQFDAIKMYSFTRIVAFRCL